MCVFKKAKKNSSQNQWSSFRLQCMRQRWRWGPNVKRIPSTMFILMVRQGFLGLSSHLCGQFGKEHRRTKNCINDMQSVYVRNIESRRQKSALSIWVSSTKLKNRCVYIFKAYTCSWIKGKRVKIKRSERQTKTKRHRKRVHIKITCVDVWYLWYGMGNRIYWELKLVY